jgi:hypothetical protein
MELFALKPAQKSPEFADMVLFLSHVSKCYTEIVSPVLPEPHGSAGQARPCPTPSAAHAAPACTGAHAPPGPHRRRGTTRPLLPPVLVPGQGLEGVPTCTHHPRHQELQLPIPQRPTQPQRPKLPVPHHCGTLTSQLSCMEPWCCRDIVVLPSPSCNACSQITCNPYHRAICPRQTELYHKPTHNSQHALKSQVCLNSASGAAAAA